MEKTKYAIVYMKNDLVDEKYISEYVPYYIAEGTDEYGFIDKDGNGYNDLDDKYIVNGDPQFCVGRRYTLEELKEKYGDKPKQILMETFFQDEKSKRLFGEETNGIFRIVEDNNYKYGINLENETYDIDELWTANDKEFDEDIYEKYICIREEILNGRDYIIINTNDLWKILEFDNKREIFNYLKCKTRDISTYFEDEENCFILTNDMINAMFNILDANSIKRELNSRLDKIDITLSPDEMIRSKFESDDEEFEEDEIDQEEKDEIYELILLLMDEVIEKYKEVFEAVRKIQEPFDKEKIDFIKDSINIMYGNMHQLIEELKKELVTDPRLKVYLEFFEISMEGLNDLLEEDDKDIQEEFIIYHNQFIENYNRMLKDNLKEFEEKKKKEEFDPEKLSKSIDESLEAFDKLIGMNNIKEEITKLLNTVLFRQKVKDLINLDKVNKHLVFLGNPGTGKTTVAKILSKVLYKLGYLESDKVVEVTAKDLVGEYVGHTAVKTAKLIKANKNGLIIIDEAYILANGSNNGNDFGKEAIAEILKEMEKNETMFIFCGYKKEMKAFLELNSGLKSRIGNNYDFQDYNVDELYEMFIKKLDLSKKENSEYKLVIDDDLEEVIKRIIELAKREKDFGNGRFIDNLYSQILAEHANNTKDTYDFDRLLTLTIEDIDENIISKMFYKENKTTCGFLDEVDKNGENELKKYIKSKKDGSLSN